jgi:membrane protein YdbS with pleckstrin-like domain
MATSDGTSAAPDPSREPYVAGLRLRQPRRRIDRHAIAWWTLRALLSWGVLTAALVVAALLWDAAQPWLIAPIAVAAVVTLAKALVEPRWRYRVHRWEIGEHATYAVTGWLVKEWRVSPTSRIQTVDSVRGPLEQALGLATLRVTTASSYGAVKISGLRTEDADEAVEALSAIAELATGDAT